MDKPIALPRKMFWDFEPEYLLDTTLKCLTSNQGLTIAAPTERASLYRQLKNDYDINLYEEEFNMIINQLKADGYVQEKGEKDIFYSLAFDGFFFIKKGGYTKTTIEQAKEKSLLTISRHIARAAAVATTIAGIYYAIEIFKIFFPDFFRGAH